MNAPFLAGSVALAALFAVGSAAPAAARGSEPLGSGINPARSVEVVMRDCGTSLCGRIAWSSPQAREDARDGGVAQLVGTELLQDYRAAGASDWHGRVLVPDMDQTFDSHLRLVGVNAIRVSGCMLGGLICRSQVWTRVAP